MLWETKGCLYQLYEYLSNVVTYLIHLEDSEGIKLVKQIAY